MCQLRRQPSRQLWFMSKIEGYYADYAYKGGHEIQTNGSPKNQCLVKQKHGQSCYVSPAQYSKRSYEQFRDFTHTTDPFCDQFKSVKENNALYPIGTSETCRLTASQAWQETRYPCYTANKNIRAFSETQCVQSPTLKSSSSTNGCPGERTTERYSEGSRGRIGREVRRAGDNQSLHSAGHQLNATESRGRSADRLDKQCHRHGQERSRYHSGHDDKEFEDKEFPNQRLSPEAKSKDHDNPERTGRPHVIPVTPHIKEDHNSHESIESDTKSQVCGDSNLSDSSCSNQSWRNVVGDSHLPDQQEESDDMDISVSILSTESETIQSKIIPHSRATRCVSTNCIVSSKTKLVPLQAMENSANVVSVVRDSHATNPNITHILPHLRATHCVTSCVCDETDTSETESQDHGNTSSSDSSCSNQSWPNDVGDSHLPDQQEESDEDDNDSGPQGNGDTNSTVDESETRTLTKNSLTLVHWNTEGANQKIGLLQREIAKHDIDIVLLQDTRLRKRQDGIPGLRVNGYHTYHIPLGIDPDVQCHGLVTLVNDRVPSKLITQPLDIGDSTEVLSVKIWHENKPIDIHNVYRVAPSNIDLLPIFTNGHTSIIAGDFNARHTSWCRTNNASGQDLRSQLDATNNFVLLNEPQVWTTTYETAIDLAICSTSLAAYADWSPFPHLVSDHIAVQVTIHMPFTYTNTNYQRGYVVKHADWDAYREAITDRLNNVNMGDTIEDHLAHLNGLIFQAADTAIPKKSDRPPIKHQYWRNNPGVMFAKRLANQATRKYRKRPTPETKQEMRDAHKQFEKICTEVKYFSWYKWATGVNQSTTSQQMWSTIRRCVGVAPRAPTHEDPETKANELCSSFAARCSPDNLSPEARQQLIDLQPEREQLMQNAFSLRADTDRHISLQELEHVMKQKDTAPGNDCITYSMINELPAKAKKCLLKLFNESLNTGQIPEEWKTACIIPIPKHGEGFRPISLLPCMSKLLDRIMLNRLLYCAKPVKDLALGFRKGVGTQDAITTLVHKLSEHRKRAVGAIFIDIEKAFEMVDKHVIMESLVKAGVKGKLLKWIHEFLSDRKAFVRFQGKASETKSFLRGIPQGSSLSPTLFNYAANSLLETELPVGVHVHSYADDFVVYTSHMHEHTAKERLQTAMNILARKMTTLGLKLSTQKTEAMWFHKNAPEWKLKIDNQPINWSKSVKYLGVMLDKRLSMAPHADYIKQRAQKRLNCLKVLSRLSGVNGKILKLTYTGAVRPIMEYGSSLVCMMSKSKQQHIQLVEHTALRLILRVPRWTYIESMYYECGLLPFRQRTEVSVVKLMIKAIADERHPLNKPVTTVYNHMRCNVSKNSWIRKARLVLHKLMPTNKEIGKELHQKIAPWAKCDFNKIVETSATKATTSPEELARMANVRIQDLHRYVHYFTDGSVDDNKAGSAFYCEGGDYGTKRLSDNSSILQAELYAIKMALHHAVDFGGIPCINIDSRAAIAVLCSQSPEGNQELIVEIKTLAERADAKPTLHWIPSHCGIEGNEIADNLAKEALTKPRPEVVLPWSRQQAGRSAVSTAQGIADAMLQQDGTWLSKISSKLVTTANERKDMLGIVDRRTQRQLYQFRCFCKTKDQVLFSTRTDCHLCDDSYTVPAKHFLSVCPAAARYREPMLEFVEDRNSTTLTIDILNSQAKRKNKELIRFLNRIKL